MAIDKALYKIINKFGSSEFEVSDKNGELIGTERAQISSLKRSSDQNLAAFMRMGSFHSESILEPGCILYDVAKNERFVLATKNAQKLLCEDTEVEKKRTSLVAQRNELKTALATIERLI